MAELYDPLTYNLMEGLVSQFKRRQHKTLAGAEDVVASFFRDAGVGK